MVKSVGNSNCPLIERLIFKGSKPPSDQSIKREGGKGGRFKNQYYCVTSQLMMRAYSLEV
jgi:hypothetical protein